MSQQEQIMKFYLELKRYKLDEFLDLTQDIRTIASEIRSKSEQMHSKYVSFNGTIGVFNKDEFIGQWIPAIVYRLDKLYAAFKTQSLAQVVDEMSLWKYYRIWKITKTFTVPGQPTWVSNKVVILESISQPKDWGNGLVAWCVVVRNVVDGKKFTITDQLLTEEVPLDQVLRIQAELYVDAAAERSKDEAREELRKKLSELTEIYTTIHAHVNRDQMIENYIQMELTTNQRILETYDYIMDFDNNPQRMLIKFKPWLIQTDHDKKCKYKLLQPLVFEVKKSDWSVVMTSWQHPHIRSWSLCKGWFWSDFASAASVRDLDYMIALLHEYVSNAGNSKYHHQDDKYWEKI